jgi:hypothetical protein
VFGNIVVTLLSMLITFFITYQLHRNWLTSLVISIVLGAVAFTTNFREQNQEPDRWSLWRMYRNDVIVIVIFVWASLLFS